MKIITEYQIRSRIDTPSYFPGDGVSNSDWDDIEIGNGDSYKEALDDALELVAQNEWVFTNTLQLLVNHELENADTTPVMELPEYKEYNTEEYRNGDEFFNFYVSIRVKLKDERITCPSCDSTIEFFGDEEVVPISLEGVLEEGVSKDCDNCGITFLMLYADAKEAMKKVKI